MESSIRFVLILAKKNFLYYNLAPKKSLPPPPPPFISLPKCIFKQTSKHLESDHSENLPVTNEKMEHFISSSFVFPRKGGVPSFLCSFGSRNKMG
jgi:hypothetical protein